MATSGDAVEGESTPLQRALDLLVFAPVGVALTVAEDLPGLIGKGRRNASRPTCRTHASSVSSSSTQGQRQLVDRVSKLFHRDETDETERSGRRRSAHGTERHLRRTRGRHGGCRRTTSAPPGAVTKPAADPADAVIVEGALAGYDTLSASQVVRRLESLGPDELRALHRHEASHRNRRTILNRAHQILEAIEGRRCR